ncbi:hypothetical protein Srut_31190 [Streptomyces rutgersensis]|nr:hypothetical protein Srut_31190 [Streptomyces rutgersensis]
MKWRGLPRVPGGSSAEERRDGPLGKDGTNGRETAAVPSGSWRRHAPAGPEARPPPHVPEAGVPAEAGTGP